jgi:DUF1365 family protein
MLSEQRSRTVARIDFDDAQGPVLQTSVSGELQAATAATLRAALWRHPLLTFGVIARIHWQALRLWSRRLHVFSKPAAPAPSVSR